MIEVPLLIDGEPLALAEVEAVARGYQPVALGGRAQAEAARSRALIEARASGSTPVYGVNTGFGSLSQHRIAPDAVRQVQRNLIRSHAAGVGAPLPEDVVRAMLLILLASLSRSHSGVRPELMEQIAQLLNRRVTPVVPSRGSVGASGDLAPLAHAALVLLGEGRAWWNGAEVDGAAALAAAGLAPMVLEAKEGLALINGTHLMTAMAALALIDVERLVEAGLCAAALAIDACRASSVFLDERLHRVRNQIGQQRVARALASQLAGSQILAAHLENDPRVQDPYCLRAAPQVMGAALDAIGFVRVTVERELARSPTIR